MQVIEDIIYGVAKITDQFQMVELNVVNILGTKIEYKSLKKYYLIKKKRFNIYT